MFCLCRAEVIAGDTIGLFAFNLALANAQFTYIDITMAIYVNWLWFKAFALISRVA